MQRDVTSKRILIYSFKTTFMALKAKVIIGEGIMIVLFDYVFLHKILGIVTDVLLIKMN